MGPGSRQRRFASLQSLGACTPPSPSLLPTWIYPSTVDDEKTRLRAALLGTQSNVDACTALDATTRQAWSDFYAAASSFANESTSYFGLGSQMDQAQSYGYQLCQWQETIAKVCTLSTPEYNPSQEGQASGNAAIANAVKWVAVAAIVGAVAYTASPAIRAWTRRLAA